MIAHGESWGRDPEERIAELLAANNRYLELARSARAALARAHAINRRLVDIITDMPDTRRRRDIEKSASDHGGWPNYKGDV